jgi:hypothetical protein
MDTRQNRRISPAESLRASRRGPFDFDGWLVDITEMKLFRNEKEVCDVERFKWGVSRSVAWRQGACAPAPSNKALSFFARIRPQNSMGVNWSLQNEEKPFNIVIVDATPEGSGYMVVARMG